MSRQADGLTSALDRLTLAGRPVMMHVSMRAFAPRLAGGADRLIDALLEQGCTILVPAFTESLFAVDRLPGKAENDDRREGPAGYDLHRLSPEVIDPEMGVFPTVVLARPEAQRGWHPLDSFAALGPSATHLLADQTPDDVYAPIRQLIDDGGNVLLVGVDLNRMTALHLAEQLAGRSLQRRVALTTGGSLTVETGGSSESFPALWPSLAELTRTVTVSGATFRVLPARDAVHRAAQAIRLCERQRRLVGTRRLPTSEPYRFGPQLTIERNAADYGMAVADYE
jgi:aminoglycoside 3-N-acetyltransferase